MIAFQVSFTIILSLIIGFIVIAIIVLAIGVGIGFCYKNQKKKSKFNSEWTPGIHESRSEDIRNSHLYEEVQALKSKETIKLNKNVAYEQVSAQ